MSKLAVVFPGIGYTADKPLLHYSRRIAERLGFEIRIINYSGFPEKVIGDRDKMVRSFQIALAHSEEMLSGIDFSAYDDIVFIGKSVGTIVAAKIAAESPDKDKIRLILYTPLEDTFSFSFGRAIAFSGTDDPWVGKEKSRIFALCEERQIPCTMIPSGNHSLESRDVFFDLEQLPGIIRKTESFLRG